MILEIQLYDGTKQNIDVGDVSEMTMDERTNNLHAKMTEAGLDPNAFYMILGEV